MRFIYISGPKIEGLLTYRDHEKSIDFEPQFEKFSPAKIGPTAALTVSQTLQLDVKLADGSILYAWGYLPEESWHKIDSELVLPPSVAGRVLVTNAPEKPEEAMAYATSLDDDEPFYHTRSGHIVIGATKDLDQFIEIATNIYVGLKGGTLACIVLRPVIVTH